MSVSVGDLAPDFELDSHRGGRVRLSSLRGRNVLVVFHPLAWTPVCATELTGLEARRARLAETSTHVLGISVDSVPTKIAWAQSLGGLSFDLLSDFHPHGAVAAQYGVLRDDGIAERAIFLVDAEGRVALKRLFDIPTHPDLDDILSEIGQLTQSVPRPS